MDKQRVIVYVDGFNFYYGLKSRGWKKYYWLDVFKFFSSFLKPHQELVEVNYFSAIPDHRGQQQRQDLFFSANRLNPRFQLHLGKFLKKTITCRTCSASHFTYEEKESDVRVATKMIADVVNNRCDVSILVSADSDLIPPIEFIKIHKPTQKIFVHFPPNRESNNLKNVSEIYVKLERHEARFKNALLEDEIELPNGFIIRRPTTWV
jgi:uncharacterized LabA/DUF88 family protein